MYILALLYQQAHIFSLVYVLTHYIKIIRNFISTKEGKTYSVLK